MADFQCDDAGRLTAQIPDARGEFFAYELRPVAPGDPRWPDLLALLAERKYPAGTAPEWACVLTRIDTEAAYFVCRIGPARWFCGCSDYMYRSHKTADGCKHCVHARSFYALCRAVSLFSGVAS